MKIKQIYFLLCLLIPSFVLLNCESKSKHGPEPRDKISGYVIDSITDQPIDSAQIIIGDILSSTRITFSNIDGWYTIFPDTFGVVDVYCRKPDYLTQKKSVDLPVDNLIINDFNFRLTK